MEWTREKYKEVSEYIQKALKQNEYLYRDIPQTHIRTVKNIKDAVRLTAKEGGEDENTE